MSQKDLAQVLGRLPVQDCPELLVGSNTCDDAAVYQIGPEEALVHTVDAFPPLINDPYDYGYIVAANSLSDCWAMGGTPFSALNIIAFPVGIVDLSVLAEILRGGAEAVLKAGAFVVGGHTLTDSQILFGMAVTGRIHPRRIITNAGAKAGDAIVLTKPIGVGAITNAVKPKAVSEDVLAGAVASMKGFNKRAAEVMLELGALAATDVTGFGLLGHLDNIARESNVTAIVDSSQVPILPGALELAGMGLVTPASFRSREFLQDNVEISDSVDAVVADVFFDAETSGGLLVALPSAAAQEMVTALNAEGHTAAVIGHFTKRNDKAIRVY